MTMASGRLLYATSTGTLSAVDFSGGLPSGTTTVLSGPAIDGQDLAVPRPARPQPPHLTVRGPSRYPAPHQPL